MGAFIQLTAADGHIFDAYLNAVAGSKMGIVVLQEIFGVNHYIRAVVDRFAANGFTAIAPALFDRKERNVELGYEGDDFGKGKKLAYGIPQEELLEDIATSLDYLREIAGAEKVGVVGYCFGGSYAWLSATELRPDAAVGYYGAMIAQAATETPHCPVMLHFGARDKHIPIDETTEKIQTAHPEIPLYAYDADHGFSCDERASYEPESAALAWSRTVAFFKEHLAT